MERQIADEEFISVRLEEEWQKLYTSNTGSKMSLHRLHQHLQFPNRL